MEVVIVDPETRRPRPGDAVGEIRIRSDSTARGYFLREDENDAVFRARLEPTGDGPWLRTGDLAFMNDGELYVTGRSKDVLIVDGTNHDAHDVERTIEECTALVKPGGCALLAVEDGAAERIVVLAELETEGTGHEAELVAGIVGAVSERHGVTVHAIGFVRPGALLRTTSGKLQRSALRDAYATRAIALVWEWQNPA